ncbi:unnamed protein product [Arctogadus glacialis]
MGRLMEKVMSTLLHFLFARVHHNSDDGGAGSSVSASPSPSADSVPLPSPHLTPSRRSSVPGGHREPVPPTGTRDQLEPGVA